MHPDGEFPAVATSGDADGGTGGNWTPAGPSARARAGSGEQILTNARIVTGTAVFTGTVHLRGGRIAAVESGRSHARSATDLHGDLLIPGLIDVHTDNLERHLEPRPGVAWPSLAALLAHDRQMAAAGITTVCDALCIGDRHCGQTRSPAVLDDALRARADAERAGLLKAQHLLHLRCEVTTEGAAEAFAAVADEPAIRLVSLMDHTPGQRQWRDLDRWRRHDPVVASNADADEIRLRRLRFPPERAAAARRDIAALARRRALVLASHDDTTDAHVAQAADEGVTICEFPTTPEAARAARARGLRVVMGSPNVVLGGSHAGNVSARALALAGLLDALASDYVPISLIEACFILHHGLGLALPEAVAVATARPAAMLGLADRGEIAPGRRADLVRVQPHRQIPVVTAVWRAGSRVA